MSLEELEFKVEQLTFQLEDRAGKHAAAVAAVRDEARALRRKVLETLERGRQPPEKTPADDTFVRTVEWRIPAKEWREKAKNEAIWSENFSIMECMMQLEFFPQGRDTTWMPGFCALFLWCPPGVQVRYQLRVGSHRSAPDHDEYTCRMGHGHSNFCFLEAQRDAATDSILVGVDILDLCVRKGSDGLVVVNRGPEVCVQQETALLTHRGMDRVEWKIRNILKRAKEVPCGSAICSPPFSMAGVRELLLELYPNGVSGADKQATPGKEGFCGFYVRCPSHHTLVLTLFVGEAKKGPIRTEFDGNTSKGLPEFCRLEDQVREGETDLVVGVAVHNPDLELEETRKEVQLSNRKH